MVRGTWLAESVRRGFAGRAVVLALALMGVIVTVLPVAVLAGGLLGIAAALLAAVVCLTASLTALAIHSLLRGEEHPLQALLAGMFVRLGGPLAFALVARVQGGPLVSAGLMYYLVLFYLASLTVETALSLPRWQTQLRGGDQTRRMV